MGKHYTQLSNDERAQLMVMLAEGQSQSAVARVLARDRSTISRELARNGARFDHNTGSRAGVYDTQKAQLRADKLSNAPGHKKLTPDTALFSAIEEELKKGWSPEQISGVLKRAFPDDLTKRVCHETIYTAIYVLPRGELRRDLIGCLRQAHGKRRPRSRGQDRRGRISDMVPLAMRPPEVEDRLVPGHWEGDLIKGKGNKSSIGTLVERTSRLVLLARMDNASAQSALKGFSIVLNSVPAHMRKTLTYDQGKEMARHKELEKATDIKVYFADPHSPWQRGSNENTNGLLRQYLPKGTDLSQYSQDDLDEIAMKLNMRPRKMFGFRTPIQIFAAHVAQA